MKPQTRKKAVTPNSTTAGTTMRASKQIVPKEGLIPCATKHNIAICKPRSAENKYIDKHGKFLCVRKKSRGKYCTFAWGKHLTLEKARLIAGKVGQLSKTTNDKTEIMKGLIPFAKKHHIGLCKPRSAENKYITKNRKFLCVRKKIRGKYCWFASGKHLTLEKAKLIAGKVGQLSKTTNDKTEIMKGLIPFAKSTT